MNGFGGIVTSVLSGGLDKAKRFLETCQIFQLAESLGGVESLIEHPAIMTHAAVPKNVREELGIEDGLIRLSVGVEHIDDLINAHVSGLKYLNKRIYEVVNIGTGKCYSVKELISTFSKILNYDIPYKIVGRRKGDIPVCYASVKKSKKFLKWKTKKNILTMCRDIIKVI